MDAQQPRSLAASGRYLLLAGHAWVPPAGAQPGSSQSGSWACNGFLSYICNSFGWFDSRLLGAYNLPGSSEMHLIWGNTNVLYIMFSFFYWVQLEKAQIWRSMNKCRSYTASRQTSWEDATSASLLALFVCFSSLEKVMIWIQSPLWVVLWLKALVPRESRHSLWFKGNLNADTQHLFFLWGLVMDFPALGYCRGKISFRFVRVVAERLRALEVSVQDWAVCAEAVLPSTAKRVLYSASDCLIFSMSTGRVAG